MTRREKPTPVVTYINRPNPTEREIQAWNEAIETAARFIADNRNSDLLANELRKLKRRSDGR